LLCLLGGEKRERRFIESARQRHSYSKLEKRNGMAPTKEEKEIVAYEKTEPPRRKPLTLTGGKRERIKEKERFSPLSEEKGFFTQREEKLFLYSYTKKDMGLKSPNKKKFAFARRSARH